MGGEDDQAEINLRQSACDGVLPQERVGEGHVSILQSQVLISADRLAETDKARPK